jgi:hypothetical protein
MEHMGKKMTGMVEVARHQWCVGLIVYYSLCIRDATDFA